MDYKISSSPHEFFDINHLMPRNVKHLTEIPSCLALENQFRCLLNFGLCWFISAWKFKKMSMTQDKSYMVWKHYYNTSIQLFET